MANAIYPKYKEALLSGSSNISLSSGNVKAILVDTNDHAYSSSDEFLDDITGGAVVSTSGNMAGKSVTNGLFDCDDFTFNSVSGDQSEAIVFYIDTGTPGTSRLVAWFDTGITGIPVTPNGGDINISINGSGIFQL